MAEHTRNEQNRTETTPLTDSEERLLMPLETLAVLDWLGEIGVEGVETRLGQVLTDELTVRAEQIKIGYAGPETSLSRFAAEDRAGARVPVESPFTGTALVMFPVKSANEAASLMLKRAVDDAESVVSTEMGRDALTELCNMMANGFVDEWASVFDTPFTTGPPVAVQNPEMTLINRIFSRSEVGLYLRSSVQIPEYGIDATLFVLPGDEQFVSKISQVDPGVIDR